MLEPKNLRNSWEAVEVSLKKRNQNLSLSQFAELDKKRRELILLTEELKSRQNAVSKQVPALKKEGKDTTEIFAEMKQISDESARIDSQVKEIEEAINEFLLNIPNAPHDSVPVGSDSEDNQEVRKVGEPRSFDFEPLPHWELGEKLGIIDPATAAKTTGSRFVFYYGLGAKLERAIIAFMLDTHAANGYTEVAPPLMVHRRSMIGTGQLPKFEEDAFALKNTEYFMVPTAEVPVTNMHRESILDGTDLTMSYCAYTPCFRSEAGSAGRDQRGLIRLHQFNKVELVKFSRPENSYEELEKLTGDAERILKLLEIPYRVVNLCAGDLGFSSAKTYDIEVWMPSYNRYVEISSCSNFETFQAVRADIRFRDKGGKPQYVHTLNGSGLAVGRTTAAILENFQQQDGSVKIPKVLLPYMGVDEIR